MCLHQDWRSESVGNDISEIVDFDDGASENLTANASSTSLRLWKNRQIQQQRNNRMNKNNNKNNKCINNDSVIYHSMSELCCPARMDKGPEAD